jgi:hypothetical protein
MDKLKKLIKESTQGLKLKKSCSCGCNTCEVTENTLFTLNENLAPREILSDGLKHHITKKKPLTENVYRAGSNSYFNLWAEARALYSRGILEIQNPNDLEILTETNLGEFGIIYEIEIGDKVKASKEYGGLTGTVVDIRGSFIVVKTKEGNESYHESDLQVLNKEGKKVPLDFIMEEEVFPFEHKGIKYNVEVTSNTTNDRGQKLYKISIDGVGSYNEYTSERDAHIDAKREIDDQLIFESKKNKPIGKPMRDSSGSKAYKVYVRDPKTKKVKTVRFGSGGLKAKINNPKARQAFAKRHDCKNKKDRTKPSYWSCRLPSYAKLLGLKSNFSGFW